MGLNYPTTQRFSIVGTKTQTYTNDKVIPASTVFVPVTLTAAYQAETNPQTTPTKSFKVTGFPKVNFSIRYTEGATETANSVQFKVEESNDGLNWYSIPNETVLAGTSTLSAREFTYTGADAALSTISVGVDIFYEYVRISFKETGVVTNFGTVYCEATLLGK